ncbi:LysR family transcriptional regulator [Betaproteobacteria bacterium]|nr:LysR family transcriptional regulator [Betaproteobacteria bacterium]
MKMRYLRYFLAVAEEQSFTRAAARVHIEPSPLSRAIKELEFEMEVQLLYRGKGRIRLTWAGEVFREEARRMLAFMEDARLRVRSAEQGYRGQLRIGLTDRLAQPPLIQLLARCREEEPLTKIKTFEMTVSEMVEALNSDQIDAGFTIHPEPGKELHKEVVWWDRFAVVIPRNHPLLSFAKIPLREVTRYPLLVFHPKFCSGGHDILQRRLFNALSSPRIAEYVSGHEPMIMLAAAGYGIGVGLESQITLYRHPDVIVRPVADDAPTPATFMVIADKPPSDELIHFITRVQKIGQMTSVHVRAK